MATNLPMTLDQVAARAPSVFATEAHESRSARYAYIPTSAVLNGLLAEGFQVFDARQSRTRDPGKREFTKHMLRLRHPDLAPTKVDDVFPEAVLVNSHDGASAYVLNAGLFRLWCLNGAVCPVGNLDGVHVRHTGKVQSEVIEGTYRIIETAAKAAEVAADWQGLQLAEPERLAIAEAAHVLRFANAEGIVDPGTVGDGISPRDLLRRRRTADTSPDLWTTFNVVQENVIKGGLHGHVSNPAESGRRRFRRVTTRAVNGIDQDVRLNKALWLVAEAVAKAHGARALAA